MIRELTQDEVEFTLECHPEEIPFVGNCSAIDAKTDARAEKWIRNELAAGNEWAWCYVIVKARWKNFEGRDSLGGCSYKSEKDFKQEGGYYEDMKAQALSNLNEVISKSVEQF